jgi:hypothetical protein
MDRHRTVRLAAASANLACKLLPSGLHQVIDGVVTQGV